MSIFFFDAQREKRRARSCLHCFSVPVLGFCGVADNVQGNKFKVIQIDITSKKVFRILRRNIPISQPMFTLADVLSVNYFTHIVVRTSCCFSNSCFVIYIYNNCQALSSTLCCADVCRSQHHCHTYLRRQPTLSRGRLG